MTVAKEAGSAPIYVKNWVPEPKFCEECGQILPDSGAMRGPPHVADCPCLRCARNREMAPAWLLSAHPFGRAMHRKFQAPTVFNRFGKDGRDAAG